MTVPSTARRAGPYTGNGVTTSFSFSFKTFAAGDLQVTRMDTLGIETTLVLNSDYSVSLNVDQDASPGGTITYPISGLPLPAGHKLTIVGDLEYEQTTDLLGGGAFNARVIEDTFDRTVIQIQQLEERLDRALLVPVNSTANVQLPNPEANELIGWDSTGSNLANYELSQLATGIAYGTTRFDTFTGNGSQTQFALTEDPAALANLDVSIAGVTQVPGTDYTLVSATIVFTSAPPNGATILARYGRALPVSGPIDSSAVTHVAAGTGAQARTVQSKLRDVVSVFDFMTSAQIADVQSNGYSVDVSGAVQAAIDANATNGAFLWFPKGTYRFNSGVTLPVNATARWMFDAPPGTTIRTSNAITLISRNPVDQTSALNTIQNNTLTVRNLTFQGSTASGQIGMSIGSTYGALVDDCHFISLDKALIFRFGLKAVIRNCFFTDNLTESIVLRHGDWSGASLINSQSNSSTVQSCRIFNRAGATSSIAVIATSDVSIRDSIIEGQNPVYGVFFDTLATPVVKNIVIDVCHLECIPTAAAFYLKGTGGTATIRSLFAQGSLSTNAYLIDNSNFYGSPTNIHISDMPNIIGANPAGYVFKTVYPSQWSFDGDFGELVASGVVKSALFESINAPSIPVVIITGGNSTGGPGVGVRTYGGLSLHGSSSASLASAGAVTVTAGGLLRLAGNAGVRIDVQLGSGDIDLVCSILRINGTQGSTGTFTTADGKTVTVTKGLITSIV